MIPSSEACEEPGPRETSGNEPTSGKDSRVTHALGTFSGWGCFVTLFFKFRAEAFFFPGICIRDVFPLRFLSFVANFFTLNGRVHLLLCAG